MPYSSCRKLKCVCVCADILGLFVVFGGLFGRAIPAGASGAPGTLAPLPLVLAGVLFTPLNVQTQIALILFTLL